MSTEPDSSASASARARAVLQAALEASADALLVTDEAGRAETGNLRFLALFGLSPAELAAQEQPSALARRLASRCREPDAAAARIESLQASSDEASDAVELADGRRFECFSQPLSLAGRPLGRIWRYREITAADAAAQAPLAEAARALRLKDEFISNLSHALRTPMGAVLGWAKALQLKRADPAALERGLDAIARNAAQQAELLDELLDADQVLSDRVRLDPRPLDMAALVAAAVEAARPAAEAKGLRLYPLLEPLGGPVSGDADRLRQVVASLLANAVKFTAQGGRIEVLLQPLGSQLELTVRDDGAGIEPARLARVFERYDPDDPSSIRSRTGLGLSLPVARRLVEMHGGSIEAASDGPDAGATFTVRLPLTPV